MTATAAPAAGRSSPGRRAAWRWPLFAGAGASLVMGLWGGLALLGTKVPLPSGGFAEEHGPLMALGFLGTLVALERAVALGRPWAYTAPALSGAGAVLAAAGYLPPGRLLLTAAAAWLTAVYVVLLARRGGRDVAVQLSGAVAWYGGGLLWLRERPVADLVPWLAAFLVLTIAGERLELARTAFLRRRATDGLLAAAALIGAGAAVSVWWQETGWRLTGIGLLALSGWLAGYDVARRTVRGRGLPRYTAVCLLAGYAWLAVAGAVWTVAGRPAGTGGYDTALHAVFLGFVMSMVFGHAPVILPAVLRIRLPYHPVLYGPLVLLHAALAVRIAGNLAGAPAARTAGGVLGEVAFAAFACCAIAAFRLTRSGSPTSGRPRASGSAATRFRPRINPRTRMGSS